MIEKGIDMTGDKDKEFCVKADTEPALYALMTQINAVEAEISTEIEKVSKFLALPIDKCPSNTHKYVLEANKKLAISKIKDTPGYKFITAKQTKLTFVTDNMVRLCTRLGLIEEEYKQTQQTTLLKMFSIVAGYYPIMEALSYILA